MRLQNHIRNTVGQTRSLMSFQDTKPKSRPKPKTIVKLNSIALYVVSHHATLLSNSMMSRSMRNLSHTFHMTWLWQTNTLNLKFILYCKKLYTNFLKSHSISVKKNSLEPSILFFYNPMTLLPYKAFQKLYLLYIIRHKSTLIKILSWRICEL